MNYQIKRIFDQAAQEDGFRILVDRLWPRGVSKEHAALDLWMKDVAPSPDLRVWFDHREDRFAEFTRRYDAELDDNPAVTDLRDIGSAHSTVTLLFGAKSLEINHAKVLLDYLARS